MRTEARRSGPRVAVAAAAVALIACAATAGGGLARSVPAEVSMPASAALDFAGGVELRSDRRTFGGLSGLEVSADGARWIAVSDTGLWVEGRLLREEGRLVGATVERMAPMRGPDAARPPHVGRDAEGLAIPAPDLSGERIVSFERDHRLGVFPDGDAAERTLRRPHWRGFSGNNGLEGLALRPDGTLLALREADAEGETPLQEALWIAPDGAERPAIMPREEGLIATGADFGPDGRLYVVDRGLSVIGGFAMRVRRLTVEGDALIREEDLLRLSGARGADNAEGIAVWRDDDGRLRVTVLTDDNFNMLQRTLLLEFVAPE